MLRIPLLDRYILGHILATMGSVLAIVISLMMLENLPRLLEMTSHSGRRGYIVAQTVVSLLPEYAGIGLPVGLFLGIALTIRKLALRGELDVIEASGISAVRWMRYPLALAAIVSLATFLNQGWLVPAGESNLAQITSRMRSGEFGHRLQSGDFIDLGSERVLLFEKIDPDGQLVGLFLRAEGNVFTAKRGHVWQLPSGAAAIALWDGQIIREGGTGVVDFARFEYHSGEMEDVPADETKAAWLRQIDIRQLWEDGTTPSRSVVYGRSLWAALVLLLPLLALILGRPPRRQSGAAGILVGIVVLVLGLKMITPLSDGHASEPEFLALGILITWGVFAFGLVRSEAVFGQGFVDRWSGRALKTLRRRNS